MQNIEELASQTYLKNIEFLQKEHYDVWYKLHLLEIAINDGRYKERYALDYIDGYFDVMELDSKNYLYASDSNGVDTQLAKQVTYDKDSYLFDGFPLYYQYEKAQLGDKAKGLEDIYPLMTYYLDNVSKQSEMKEIEKFIFIGVGLGGHILEIDKKIKGEEYFIIEDDLELFKLSLFKTPYYELSNATLFFSVGDGKKEFTNKFKDFLQNSFFRNKYLKYSLFPAHSQEKIKLIKNALSSQPFALFPYKTTLSKYIRTLRYLKSEYRFLNLANKFEQSQISTKPLLIISAGPSLDTNMVWLKQNYKKFVILALSATLKTLCKHDIVPDIVTHLDGFEASLKHFENFDAKGFLQNSIAVVGGFTPPEALGYFAPKNVYILEDHATFYNDGFNAYTGPCVGSSSIMWATTMGFENIYLLGIDFAISKSGLSHSKEHQLTKTKYDTKDIQNLTSQISFRENFFEIKGNFKDKVYTTPLFYDSVLALQNTLKKLKKDTQKIYNLNDGAYLEGTIPTHCKDIDISSFEDVSKIDKTKYIKECFLPYSKQQLDEADMICIEKRLEFAKEIGKMIENYNSQPLSTHPDRYLYNLISVALNLLVDTSRERANLVAVYDYYLSYTMALIFDFFNTKGLKNSKKHIKHIDKIFVKGLLSINNIYKEELENFLSKE